MKKQTFIIGALILSVGGFISKVIGAFYKIPLANILGSSGMGIYYLIFPLYNIMLVISSTGVSVAVTKLVARSRVKQLKKNETTYLKAGLLISFMISFGFFLIMCIFAKEFAYYQGNVLSYMGFLVIAPAIIVASLVSVIKGYFQGIENMIPSSMAMIIEQLVKMIAGLLLSFKLLKYGMEYAVMGAALAVTISESVTFIIMSINYLCHKKYNDKKFYNQCAHSSKLVELKPNFKVVKQLPCKIVKNQGSLRKYYYLHSSEKLITFKRAIKETFTIMIPNTLVSFVMALITLVDSFLVINLLTSSGYSSYTATSLYGINNGAVLSIVALPVVIISALSTVVVPNMSGIIQSKNKEKISDRVSLFIKTTWVIVLPIFVYFLVMHSSIISALYNFSTNSVINEYGFASKLLLISSVSIIYNAILSTLISILQSMDKAYNVFIILLIGIVLRTVISIVLIKNIAINIFGIVIANISFLIFGVCGCTLILKRNIELSLNYRKFFIIPLIASFVSGGLIYILSILLETLNVWIKLFVCGIVLLLTYLGLIISLKCFEEKEMKYLNFFKGK